MKWTSIVAIYFLFFCFTTFALLPFGVRTSDEVGEELVPGQAESAPHRFDLRRHLVRSALIAVPLCALYVANYAYGWLGVDDFDFYN